MRTRPPGVVGGESMLNGTAGPAGSTSGAATAVWHTLERMNIVRKNTLAGAALLLALTATAARAQINAGEQKPEASLPFTVTQVATFNLPWRIAFLPDGRMLITEKPGAVWLVTQQGAKTPVANVPPVLHQGQGGLLGVFVSPRYATDHNIYLTYSEPGDGGSSLALARAKLTIGEAAASL